MKNTFYIIITGFILIACNKNNKINLIETYIEKNKNETIFLSFFPNMDTQTFKFLLKKETRNKNLIEEKNDFSTLHYYEIPLNNEKLNFYIYNQRYGIELSHFYTKYSPEPTRGISEHGNYEYQKTLNDLIKLYSSKYGEVETIKNILKDNSKDIEELMYQNKNYYVFRDENKIVVLDGNFTYDYVFSDNIFGNDQIVTLDENKNILTYSYRINIHYYSTNSFDQMRNQKINDSLNFIEMKRIESEQIEKKKIKEETKLLNDI